MRFYSYKIQNVSYIHMQKCKEDFSTAYKMQHIHVSVVYNHDAYNLYLLSHATKSHPQQVNFNFGNFVKNLILSLFETSLQM